MPKTDAKSLTKNRGMSPDDFHDMIPRMVEVADEPLQVPENLFAKLDEAAADLVIDPTVLREIGVALLAGSVVLQGPPGTGKSTLARALAGVFNVDLYAVTAHQDWSTFDVIGRQELRIREGKEEVIPVDGHFTEAAIRCAGNIPTNQDDPNLPQATWLMVDELNRADPDKAFGELFSVLGTDEPVAINLSYQRSENAELTVPRRFRIVATVNSVDKQFVNGLSQGLRRRFSFVTIDVPKPKDPNEEWDSGVSPASREFIEVQRQAKIRAARTLGKPESDFEIYLDQSTLIELFELIAQVRYANEGSDFPYVPVGTAPIVDALHAYLIRAYMEGGTNSLKAFLDWSVSVKIVPMFESGGLNPAQLIALADSVPSAFQGATRAAIRAISTDGVYFDDGV